MTHFTTATLGAMLAAALIASPLLRAQSPAAPQTGPASEASPMFQRHHAMAGIMKDMMQEMARMQEELSKGEPSPERSKEIARDMKRMSQMMLRMSGWADHPTMMQPEMRREAEQMRKEMNEMSLSSTTKGHRK